MRFIVFLSMSLMLLTSCTENKSTEESPRSPIEGETFAVGPGKLKNCRFKNPNPTYTFGSTIEPNTILCDEGVPKRAEKLSTASLPQGLKFAANQLELVGIANERLTNAPYEFYLENESGYVVIKIQISIQ